jgi:hypothetical protein
MAVSVGIKSPWKIAIDNNDIQTTLRVYRCDRVGSHEIARAVTHSLVTRSELEHLKFDICDATETGIGLMKDLLRDIFTNPAVFKVSLLVKTTSSKKKPLRLPGTQASQKTEIMLSTVSERQDKDPHEVARVKSLLELFLQQI